jgi:peptidoglycan/xylan/chitin deacetylase (PgdA/CDA1 family)
MNTEVSVSRLGEREDLTKHRYVTISVDDGYPGDLKAADLFRKYGLHATFYIPADNPERPLMTRSQVRELGQAFEIGSHTYHHTPLKSMSEENAWAEIQDGKKWLEDTLGESPIAFCYPRGKVSRRAVALVKRAGFFGARTSLHHLCHFPDNPFLWGVTTLAHRHSKIIHVRHALLERNFVGVRNFFLTHKGATDWQEHFSYGLDDVAKNGGIAHLCLHSWEIEELGEWRKLESVLDSVARRGLTSVTNGNLFRLWAQVQDENAVQDGGALVPCAGDPQVRELSKMTAQGTAARERK